ncbi:carbon storage regulator, CsrA [Pseudomonas linyingensis]|uniref:Translational regulator CsrA n=1 Tax=Pseudomonas linyingensis TaxID=915471 RepID=A0A1H6YYK1_9PSED|nr:carbon storage regulator [Pseudomonas linyingensis]SEJ46298.1 carbon storage regulator, CsrA [Pseudomonas linyingensis]
MALILGRRVGEKIRLTIDSGVDPQEALRRLLEDGIDIEVVSIKNNNHVRLAIAAPRELLVLREELVEGGNGHLSRPDADNEDIEF